MEHDQNQFVFDEVWTIKALQAVCNDSPYNYSGHTCDHGRVWSEISDALCQSRQTEEHCTYTYVLTLGALGEFVASQ